MSKSRTEIDKEIMYRKIMPSASKRDAKTAQADTGNSGAGQSDTALYDRVNGEYPHIIHLILLNSILIHMFFILAQRPLYRVEVFLMFPFNLRVYDDLRPRS